MLFSIATEYPKHVGKNCSYYAFKYKSIDEAKQVCTEDSSCTGVHVRDCDEWEHNITPPYCVKNRAISLCRHGRYDHGLMDVDDVTEHVYEKKG